MPMMLYNAYDINHLRWVLKTFYQGNELTISMYKTQLAIKPRN